MKTQPIHVSKAAHAAIKKYAASKGVTLAEAVDALVTTAVKRKKAVDKYNAAKK